MGEESSAEGTRHGGGVIQNMREDRTGKEREDIRKLGLKLFYPKGFNDSTSEDGIRFGAG